MINNISFTTSSGSRHSTQPSGYISGSRYCNSSRYSSSVFDSIYETSNRMDHPFVTIDMNKTMSFAKLDIIKQYPEGWDGEDADIISERLIDMIKVLLDGLGLQPEIAAAPSGSILLHYETCSRSFLNFNIFEDRLIYSYIKQGNFKKAITGTVREIPNFKKTIEKWVGAFERECLCC